MPLKLIELEAQSALPDAETRRYIWFSPLPTTHSVCFGRVEMARAKPSWVPGVPKAQPCVPSLRHSASLHGRSRLDIMCIQVHMCT